MRLIPPNLWYLVGVFTYLESVVDAVAPGALEVSVVFPRINETYAPASMFPIVYALENAEMARNLNLVLGVEVRNGPDFFIQYATNHYNLPKTYGDFSRSKGSYFVYEYMRMETEGDYQLASSVHWAHCNLSGNDVAYLFNHTYMSVRVPFNIKEGGRNINLVEITADENETCSVPAFSIDVGTETREVVVPNPVTGTYAVMASSSPTLTLNPCRVKIDKAADASMLAAVLAANCGGLNPPPACPKGSTAARNLAVGGAAAFAFVLGAVGFLLA
ncbi:hypothetical protein TWF481_001535 [Arthrobotrys musiformis]|uniref:DUF7136 domain-containing protein n=1 Tax=Arthrobotrys musiformis TaxID=47236 RepID=A0AAV9WQW2_9PEZI